MPSDLAHKVNANQDRLRQARAVVLPDLYVDHLVPIENRQRLNAGIERLIEQGGGNLLTAPHHLQLGGNAANTAHALANLGVPTTLIAPTNTFGRALYEDATKNVPATLEGLIPTPQASSTVALELEAENANVMLSAPGPLATFGPDDLDEDAWNRIENADAVAVTNWAQTLEHGTQLLKEVLPRAHAAGAFTFMDTGDPAHRGDDVDALLESLGALDALDAWGMNEHEATHFAARITDQDPSALSLKDAARALDEHVGCRIDVHTADNALSMQSGHATQAGTFPVKARFLTGAGDAWNAGNIAAILMGFEGQDRLSLANAVAGLSISRPAHARVTLADVTGFLSEQ